MRPLACRQDVLSEVWAVDRVPDLSGHLLGGLVGQCRVPVEVGGRLFERSGSQQKKALDVPPSGIVFRRIDVDAAVKEIRDEDEAVLVGGWLDLENVQSLEDHHVGAVKHEGF